MKILFIAIPNSVHTARWISQITDCGWDLRLFSAWLATPQSDFRNITILGSRSFRRPRMNPSVSFVGWTEKYFYCDWIMEVLRRRMHQNFRQRALIRAIREFRPDIIHSLEFQHAGYLALYAKERIGSSFPVWIATNWGSDIYLYRKISEHETKIRKILNLCDYYSGECERDVHIAREMGLTGKILPVLPNAGGMPIDAIYPLRSPGPISGRKIIMLKGYQGWSGRALVALEAIKLCKESLGGYTIIVYSASRDVLEKSRKVEKETGITIRNLPQCSHEEILRLFGRARIYIGLGISDGISTSLLEAMVMGAFPIQSCTACADEWIVDGKSGFIVPPEDPVLVAEAIQKALTDDPLVNLAAEINAKTTRERLDTSVIKPQVVKLYEDVYQARKG
jgi:glycosyltransferase involved in cell wall biosynthesis